MRVSELCDALGAKAVVMPSPDREIKGAYVGDLLSWVMGKAEADNVWVTIMSNLNVIAVASLCGFIVAHRLKCRSSSSCSTWAQ